MILIFGEIQISIHQPIIDSVIKTLPLTIILKLVRGDSHVALIRPCKQDFRRIRGAE